MTRPSEDISQASVQTPRRNAIVWNRREELAKRQQLQSKPRWKCVQIVSMSQCRCTAQRWNTLQPRTPDQARGHPFLIHGRVTVGSRANSSDQHAKAAMRVPQAALYIYAQDVIRDARAHEMEVWKANERIATATVLRELRVASVVAERRLHNTWRMRRRRITTTPWHLSQSSSKNTTRRGSVRKNMTSTT